MKKILSVLVILLSPLFVFAQVTSTGVGTVYTKPDCAHLIFSISTHHEKAKIANAENKKSSDDFFELIKKHKIDEKDVSTQYFNISSVIDEGNLLKPKSPTLVGYNVHHQILVRVRDIKTIGQFIDESVDNKVHLSSIQFAVSNQKDLEDQARDLALENAKFKASRMVKKLGAKLGVLKSIQEINYGFNTNAYAERSLPTSSNFTSIAIGQMAITVRVSANWDIEALNLQDMRGSPPNKKYHNLLPKSLTPDKK